MTTINKKRKKTKEQKTEEKSRSIPATENPTQGS